MNLEDERDKLLEEGDKERLKKIVPIAVISDLLGLFEYNLIDLDNNRIRQLLLELKSWLRNVKPQIDEW